MPCCSSSVHIVMFRPSDCTCWIIIWVAWFCSLQIIHKTGLFLILLHTDPVLLIKEDVQVPDTLQINTLGVVHHVFIPRGGGISVGGSRGGGGGSVFGSLWDRCWSCLGFESVTKFQIYCKFSKKKSSGEFSYVRS
uniref:Uncharacterized protein n=1 Tax=Cacopsylla melanoneura TaxID=428564 RepID=A0A8D8LGL7_9HEMI